MPLLFPVTLHFILNELFLESEGFDLKLIIRIIVRDLYTLEICSRLQHDIGLDNVICCFGEEAFQNSFVDGREDVGSQQRLNILFFKTGW